MSIQQRLAMFNSLGPIGQPMQQTSMQQKKNVSFQDNDSLANALTPNNLEAKPREYIHRNARPSSARRPSYIDDLLQEEHIQLKQISKTISQPSIPITNISENKKETPKAKKIESRIEPNKQEIVQRSVNIEENPQLPQKNTSSKSLTKIIMIYGFLGILAFIYYKTK